MGIQCSVTVTEWARCSPLASADPDSLMRPGARKPTPQIQLGPYENGATRFAVFTSHGASPQPIPNLQDTRVPCMLA